ncbi:MAG TPA: nuclear transport factor 2 family protein [Phnomibacter sp.]|nr:nuclear transport factor 2 family protein [Phnomibacter sp.]
MKSVFCCAALAALLIGCNQAPEPASEPTAATSPEPPMDMPYSASYSGSWTSDVSDADLKTVLMSYKTWETGDMAGLAATLGDSIWVDMSSGDVLNGTRNEVMARWTASRDSMSSVSIEMEAYHKMNATGKQEPIVVVWYKQVETYKDGRVDSARYHDINMLKDGKIVWYSQYKRPLK